MFSGTHFSGTAWSATGKISGPSLNWMKIATGTWSGLASDHSATSVRHPTRVGHTEW